MAARRPRGEDGRGRRVVVPLLTPGVRRSCLLSPERRKTERRRRVLESRRIDRGRRGQRPRSRRLARLRAHHLELLVHVDGGAAAVRLRDVRLVRRVPVGVGLENTVTSGIVSATGRELRAPNGATITGAIQTDAAINHGNSGGPLLNDRAEVIGVTSQIESESGGNDGVGFAIPSSTVRQVVAHILGASA
ncbi:MAG: S1C family serine protease [Pseudomonadota bacterium]